MFEGFIVGLVIGIFISYNFVFPANVLALKLVAMTIGDLLRILGGISVIGLTTWIGAAIGGIINDR